jgi:hypothetical protein
MEPRVFRPGVGLFRGESLKQLKAGSSTEPPVRT